MTVTQPEQEKQLEETGKYHFQMIIVSKGVNHHGTLRRDVLKFDQKYKEISYTIDSGNLFLISRNPFQVLADKLRGIKHRFLVVFKEGEKEALNLSHSEKIPSEILYIASKSGALKGALSELFSKQIGGKKILFIIIIVAIVAIIYLAQTGKLNQILQILR